MKVFSRWLGPVGRMSATCAASQGSRVIGKQGTAFCHSKPPRMCQAVGAAHVCYGCHAVRSPARVLCCHLATRMRCGPRLLRQRQLARPRQLLGRRRRQQAHAHRPQQVRALGWEVHATAAERHRRAGRGAGGLMGGRCCLAAGARGVPMRSQRRFLLTFHRGKPVRPGLHALFPRMHGSAPLLFSCRARGAHVLRYSWS
jgi:hypothetical protein